MFQLAITNTFVMNKKKVLENKYKKEPSGDGPH